MAYATHDELREYLPQVTQGPDVDALLDKILVRATAIVDLQLGFSFAALGDEGTDKDLRAEADSEYLNLPAHQAGSVTAVLWVTGKGSVSETTEEVTDYEELEDGRLWREAGWMRRQWYRVTAVYGYGAAPEAIKQVVLEVAVNLWGARDARQISDVVGVEGGGAVGYNRALTNRQRMIIEDVRAAYGAWGFA